MTPSRARQSLEGFITQEQAIFQSLPITTSWGATLWSVERWLPQRLKQQTITFETHRQSLEKYGYSVPPKAALPLDFQDFCKALIVYLQRTRSLKFSLLLISLTQPTLIFICRTQTKRTKRRAGHESYSLVVLHHIEGVCPLPVSVTTAS